MWFIVKCCLLLAIAICGVLVAYRLTDNCIATDWKSAFAVLLNKYNGKTNESTAESSSFTEMHTQMCNKIIMEWVSIIIFSCEWKIVLVNDCHRIKKTWKQF